MSSWGNWVLDENESCIIYAKSNSVLNEVKKSKHVTNYIYALTSGGIFAENTAFSEATLATPIQDGYKFEGWYESEDFSGSAVTDASVGKTYYAKWTEDKDDSIYGQSKNVDLGIIAEGGSTSATVGFTGTIALDRAESDHNYFTADISGMTVTITPVDGLKPGTYNDTIYVYTETGATHFIYVTLTVTEKSAAQRSALLAPGGDRVEPVLRCGWRRVLQRGGPLGGEERHCLRHGCEAFLARRGLHARAGGDLPLARGRLPGARAGGKPVRGREAHGLLL